MIDKYRQAKEYLDSFLNYEKISHFSYKRSFKLERMRILLKHLKISYQDLKVIHIAGTKGKGSTAHFLAYLLAASGFKTGLFTSPHLFDFRERIQIVRKTEDPSTTLRASRRQKTEGGVWSSLISKEELTVIIEEFRMQLEKLKFSKKMDRITFFEFSTALAFKYFIQKRVDFVILESGLGGRLDSTNVVSPLACIITHIGYDHMDKLGKKLTEIAGEKAGIVKKNTPLICSFQRAASLKVIKSKCRVKNALLLLLGRDFKVKNLRIKKKLTLFDFGFDNLNLKGLKIYLRGRYQAENASLALAALSLLEKKGAIAKEIDYKGGLEHCFFPGRFEVVSKSPLIIVDVAHNASSFLVLGDNLKTYFPQKKIILIFACSQDKDAKNMLKEIDYSYLILTRFNNSRSQDSLELKRIVKGESVCLAKDIGEALKQAKEKYKNKWAIVISGSLFLVSEAKKLLQ